MFLLKKYKLIVTLALSISLVLTFNFFQRTKHIATPPKILTSQLLSGSYYVGTVHGDQDYVHHTNVHLESFDIMRYEVSTGLYQQVRTWAISHGYTEDLALPPTNHPLLPIQGVDWWDAILFANALSEWLGYRPYYQQDSDAPLRYRPQDQEHAIIKTNASANGFRLPTYEIWQVAARGGHLALEHKTYGHLFAGANQSDEVAWFPHNSENRLHPIGQKKMNALGLYDMTGNVAEWLQTSMQGLVNMKYYCGGRFNLAVKALSQCDVHSRGFREDGLGFRLVKPSSHHTIQ